MHAVGPALRAGRSVVERCASRQGRLPRRDDEAPFRAATVAAPVQHGAISGRDSDRAAEQDPLEAAELATHAETDGAAEQTTHKTADKPTLEAAHTTAHGPAVEAAHSSAFKAALF